jgi:hypothetical protein
MAMMFPVYTVRSAADQQITVACMGAHVTEWVPPAAPWQPPPLPAAVRTVRKKK